MGVSNKGRNLVRIAGAHIVIGARAAAEGLGGSGALRGIAEAGALSSGGLAVAREVAGIGGGEST